MPLILTGTSSSTTLDSSAGLTFSDSSNQSAAASPYVLKNRIINGGFNISQYNGTSIVTPSGVGYYIDRWYIDTYGSSFNSLTMQQLSASPPTGFSNYLQIVSGSTTYTNINLSQSIETVNCFDLAGQTVTLSFWYKVPVNWTNQWVAYISSNTSSNTKINGGSSGTTASTGLTLANTTTWTKATLTYTIPSNAQTIGVLFSNGNNNLINGAQFQITGVQLELGTSATPFERRLYNQELANCQRYCQRWTGNGISTQAIIAMGMQTSTTGSVFNVQSAVPMRAAPTITFSSLIVSNSIDFDAAASVVGIDAYASTSSYVGVTHTAAGAATRPVRLSPASGSSGFFNFSAEL